MPINQRALVDVQFEERIAWVTLNNGPVNALGSDLLDQLTGVFDDLASSDVADVVVVSSALNIFSAGADVKAMKRLSNAERIEYFRRVGRLLSRLESVPFWTVSLVEGKAIGAGADLSLACDFVFASSEAMWSFPGYLNGIRLGVKRLVESRTISGVWFDGTRQKNGQRRSRDMGCGIRIHEPGATVRRNQSSFQLSRITVG